MKRLNLVLAGLFLVLATLSAGDGKHRKLDADLLFENVTKSAQTRIANGELNSAHLIVLQDGKTVLNACYGYRGIESQAPMQGNEVYRIASMTKPVTALALLIEHERGHLNIYDDVSKYIPEFADMYLVKKDSEGKPMHESNGALMKGEKAVNSVKLYQLVSHASGIGEIRLPKEELKNCTVASACEYLAGQPLNFEPGTEQSYSTGAFDVAARIIELVSGLEFEEYLKVNIFSKLGMTDTTFEPNDGQWDRMVVVQGRHPKGWPVDQPRGRDCVFGDFPTTYHAAGASLASTASDYAKFAQMFLDGGKGPHGRVIGKKTLELYSKPVIGEDIMPGPQKWGLGVRVIGKGYHLPENTFGWSGAYGSHFWIDPVNNIVAVYMKNSSSDGGAGSQTGLEFEFDVMKSFK